VQPEFTSDRIDMTTIRTHVSDDVAHLVIFGRLVHGEGAPAAMQRAICRCAASSFRLLVVDMRAVGLFDAGGLTALVVAYSAARSLGAGFELANVPRRINNLLAVSRLNTIFQL
jgi:anti-anti-sigma factor